ncbi:hypothetical protein Cgig2_019517 [Carnegiea gigantea]|uniref:Uncharacterized protein n=1 Tax=Carnegiea gigantea TaxID=171969 RepID=A0A9Q1KHG1_9CARY|nr:hypothetical protein Cgig2_019517 [Carnegiea gigantea]
MPYKSQRVSQKLPCYNSGCRGWCRFSSVPQMTVYVTNPEFARNVIEYAPSETGSSTEDTVSMVDESCEAVGGSSSEGDDAEEVHADSAGGSEKGKSQKRRREPTVEGRRWRRKAAGDGLMFDKEGRGLRGIVLVSVRGRCTLEKICKFNKTLEPYQKEAIEGTILKPILEYHPFSMQRELTVALVKLWVSRRKAFRVAGRLVPFSVYDVARFTGLPVTGKIVEFGEDDLFTTELARMVCLCMGQYVTKKGDNLKSEKGRKRPVFRNYIKMMKKLLDTNKESEFIRGEVSTLSKWLKFDFVSHVWFYEHTTRFMQHDKCRFPRLVSWDSVDHRERYDPFQLVEGIKESEVIPVLRPREEEMLVPMVKDFMKTDRFRDYILDGEGVLSYEECLERAREELRAEKGKHKSRTNELEARLNMCAPPATVHEFRAVKGGEEDATCQTTADIPGASCDAQSTPPRMVDAAAPVDDCDDVGDAPQCSESHVQPSIEVEDVGGRAIDTTAMPCREVVVGAQEPVREQQQLEPVVGESGALLRPHGGEEAANIDAPGPGVDEVYVGGDSAAREGVCTTPASSAANVQDCTPTAMEGVEYEPTVDPGMESVHHGPPMTADKEAADHEACVQPPMGESVQRVITLEEDAQITGETKRTSPDLDDVVCEDDSGGKSSNIIARMRRKPRLYDNPFTDPTRLLGAQKSKKERNEGMTGVDEPRAANDPDEGSVHPSVLNVQPLSVEGSGIGPSVEELNKLKLTKQVLMNFACMYLVVCVVEMCHSSLRIMQVLAGYISATFSATEMELVTNVRSSVSLRLACVLTLTNREEDQQECLPKLVPTS